MSKSIHEATQFLKDLIENSPHKHRTAISVARVKEFINTLKNSAPGKDFNYRFGRAFTSRGETSYVFVEVPKHKEGSLTGYRYMLSYDKKAKHPFVARRVEDTRHNRPRYVGDVRAMWEFPKWFQDALAVDARQTSPHKPDDKEVKKLQQEVEVLKKRLRAMQKLVPFNAVTTMKLPMDYQKRKAHILRMGMVAILDAMEIQHDENWSKKEPNPVLEDALGRIGLAIGAAVGRINGGASNLETINRVLRTHDWAFKGTGKLGYTVYAESLLKDLIHISMYTPADEKEMERVRKLVKEYIHVCQSSLVDPAEAILAAALNLDRKEDIHG